MATVTIDLSKMEGLATEAAEKGLRGALGRAEQVLKGDVLSRPGTGRIYKRGGRTHQASAPGNPPAADTGSLRANTNADPNLREDGQDIVGQVVANSAAARALEEGTERMAARPFLGLLGTDYRDEMTKAFIDGAKG